MKETNLMKGTNLKINYISPEDIGKLNKLQVAVHKGENIEDALNDIVHLQKEVVNIAGELAHWLGHDVFNQASKVLIIQKQIKNPEYKDIKGFLTEQIASVSEEASKKIKNALIGIESLSGVLTTDYKLSDIINKHIVNEKHSNVLYKGENLIFNEKAANLSGDYLVLHVLANLVDNAEDKGGATETIIKTYSKDGFLNIEVKDNGTGIPQQSLHKLGKEKIESDTSGIFIMQTKEDLQKIGGDLTFRNNEPEKGATFTITIPQHQGSGGGFEYD